MSLQQEAAEKTFFCCPFKSTFDDNPKEKEWDEAQNEEHEISQEELLTMWSSCIRQEKNGKV
jgi:hypothetical protein